MRVLILGASSLGMSGSICAALAQAGHEAFVVDELPVEQSAEPRKPPVLIVGGYGDRLGFDHLDAFTDDFPLLIMPRKIEPLPEIGTADEDRRSRMLHCSAAFPSEPRSSAAAAAYRTVKDGVWVRRRGSQNSRSLMKAHT